MQLLKESMGCIIRIVVHTATGPYTLTHFLQTKNGPKLVWDVRVHTRIGFGQEIGRRPRKRTKKQGVIGTGCVWTRWGCSKQICIGLSAICPNSLSLNSKGGAHVECGATVKCMGPDPRPKSRRSSQGAIRSLK